MRPYDCGCVCAGAIADALMCSDVCVQELLLTLKEPLLPPGLLLELSGSWNNPCRALIPRCVSCRPWAVAWSVLPLGVLPGVCFSVESF